MPEPLDISSASSVQKATAPYVSYATFKNFISGLRTSGGAPIVIDNSVFGGMSGGYRTQLKGALRFLGLIDEMSRPTTLMHEAVIASGDANKWKAFIGGLLTSKFSAILAHPLTSTTLPSLRKEFETTFGGQPGTISKALTFFLHAAREAGIPLSQRLTERQYGSARRSQRKRAEPAATAASNGDKGTAGGLGAQLPAAISDVTAEGLTRLLKDKPPKVVQTAIWTLIQYLTIGIDAFATTDNIKGGEP